MINSRTLVAIFASLAFALAFASCEQATDPTPEPTPIDKELAGIQFLSEAGYTQEEIDAITAELLALYGNNDLAGLSEYVQSLTFRPSADGRTISLVGADGEQVATIITNSTGRVQILGDLTAGRDAAYDARNPYVPTPGPDYIDTKIGGIEFVTASSVEFSEEQVAAIQAQLDELDEAAVAGFAEYVERVTFGQNVQGEDGENFIIDVNTGEDATAVIYINYDATAAEIKAALDAAQAKVEAERTVAAGPDPDEINNGLIDGFVLTGNQHNPDVQVQVYTHGLTNAQRAAIVAGEDTSHATAGNLQERFEALNALAMTRIADNDITKFVIIANERMTEGELSVQFVDFTNRSDDSDGFAMVIPFENDPRQLGPRINEVRQWIEAFRDGLDGIPTPGVHTIWPLPGMTSAGGATVTVTNFFNTFAG